MIETSLSFRARRGIRTLLLFVALVAATAGARAQGSLSYGLMAGYHVGNASAVEVGIGRVRHIPFRGLEDLGDVVVAGYTLTAEIDIARRRLGPRLSMWFNGFISLGFTLGYTQGFDGDWPIAVIRPEVGLGIVGARVIYGYNILTPTGDPTGTTHELGVQLYIPVIKFPEERKQQ